MVNYKACVNAVRFLSPPAIEFRLCHNVILTLSASEGEGSRLLNYRRDSSVALLPQNDKMVILRDCDTD